jgi:hypothetical protein
MGEGQELFLYLAALMRGHFSTAAIFMGAFCGMSLQAKAFFFCRA